MKIGAPPSGSETRRTAIHLAACAGLFGFSATFLWCAWPLPFRKLWYEPVQHAWILSDKPPTFVSMDYFFRVALALAAGAVLAAIAGFAAHRRVRESLVRAAGIWALALTVLAMAWYGWSFAHRAIHPPPDAPGDAAVDRD